MAKKIKRGEYPANTYIPTTHYNVKSDPFDTLIKKMGYKVKIYKSTLCPCALSNQNNAQATCTNCRGIGYIFYNPVETRAIITSINYRDKIHEWTVENIGTVSVTTYDNVVLTLMDKIEILDVDSRSTQLATVQPGGFVHLQYKPIEVCEIFSFIDSESPLNQIDLFTIEDYGIRVTNPNLVGKRISVRYKHLPIYLVVDMPHNIRQSTFKEWSGEITQDNFPIQAVARVAHFALDMPDFNGDKLQNNDTE